MNARSTLLALFLFAAPLASPARAQLTPIGPFTGTDSEGFQTQPAGQPTNCVVGRVFNDRASLCTPNGVHAHISGTWFASCALQPHGGTQQYGSSNGPSVYVFDTPVKRFGGWFATNSGHADALVTFWDGFGNVLGVETATIPPSCTWNWNAWEASGYLVKRVQVSGLNPFGGGLVMMDDMEADYGGPQGTPYCFGDGTGAPCPCANFGAPGQGCAHSQSATGAELAAFGSSSVADDALVLQARHLPSQQFALFYVGDAQAGGGLGTPLFDGLACVTGNTARYPIQGTGGGGFAGGTLEQYNPIANSGGLLAAPGETWHFQCWFRNAPASASSCGTAAGFSNGLSVTYTP